MNLTTFMCNGDIRSFYLAALPHPYYVTIELAVLNAYETESVRVRSATKVAAKPSTVCAQ